MKLDQAAVRTLPEKLCRDLRAVAFSRTADELWVAMVDQTCLPQLSRAAKPYRVRPLVVTADLVERLLASAVWTESGRNWYDHFRERLPSGVVLSEVRVSASSEGWDDTPIQRVANLILSQAVNDGASEIQMLPFPKSSAVYYRIDGVLHEVMSPPLHVHAPLLRRLRSVCRMDSPNAGWATFRHYLTSHRFAVRFLSCEHGEIALFERPVPGNVELPESFLRALQSPRGLIAVEAPEGHGLRITFGAVLEALQARRPVGIASWSHAWSATPTIWAPTGQAELLQSLLSYQPSAVVLEEVTDGGESLSRLSLDCLVVAGSRDAKSFPEPLLGVLRQRMVRHQCSLCRGKGCDRCKMTGCQGWSLVSHWSPASEAFTEGAPEPSLQELIAVMVERGEVGGSEAEQVLETLPGS